MVVSCCVSGCSKRHGGEDSVSFHRLPNKDRFPEKYQLWLSAISRKNFVPKDHHRVCGRHFISGKANSEPNNPDYVPTLHMRYEENAMLSPGSQKKRYNRIQKKESKVYVPMRSQSSMAYMTDRTYKFLDEKYVFGLMQTLNHMWMSQQLCDAVIHIDDYSVPVHKVVMLASSPVFHTLLETEEQTDGKCAVRVRGQGVTFGEVSLFITYMYTGLVDLKPGCVHGIKKLSVYFKFKDLERHCNAFLKHESQQEKQKQNLVESTLDSEGQMPESSGLETKENYNSFSKTQNLPCVSGEKESEEEQNIKIEVDDSDAFLQGVSKTDSIEQKLFAQTDQSNEDRSPNLSEMSLLKSSAEFTGNLMSDSCKSMKAKEDKERSDLSLQHSVEIKSEPLDDFEYEYTFDSLNNSDFNVESLKQNQSQAEGIGYKYSIQENLEFDSGVLNDDVNEETEFKHEPMEIKHEQLEIGVDFPFDSDQGSFDHHTTFKNPSISDYCQMETSCAEEHCSDSLKVRPGSGHSSAMEAVVKKLSSATGKTSKSSAAFKQKKTGAEKRRRKICNYWTEVKKKVYGCEKGVPEPHALKSRQTKYDKIQFERGQYLLGKEKWPQNDSSLSQFFQTHGISIPSKQCSHQGQTSNSSVIETTSLIETSNANSGTISEVKMKTSVLGSEDKDTLVTGKDLNIFGRDTTEKHNFNLYSDILTSTGGQSSSDKHGGLLDNKQSIPLNQQISKEDKKTIMEYPEECGSDEDIQSDLVEPRKKRKKTQKKVSDDFIWYPESSGHLEDSSYGQSAKEADLLEEGPIKSKVTEEDPDWTEESETMADKTDDLEKRSNCGSKDSGNQKGSHDDWNVQDYVMHVYNPHIKPIAMNSGNITSNPKSTSNVRPYPKNFSKTVFTTGVILFKAYLLESKGSQDFEKMTPVDLDSMLSRFYLSLLNNHKLKSYSMSDITAIPSEIGLHFTSHSVNREFTAAEQSDFHVSNQIWTGILKKIREKRADSSELAQRTGRTVTSSSSMFDLTNPETLQHKILWDVVSHFEVETPSCLLNMKTSSFVVEKDSSDLKIVRFSDSADFKTIDPSCTVVRSAKMIQEPGSENCPVLSFELYLSKLNPRCSYLFQRPKKGSVTYANIWYREQPLGFNALCDLMDNVLNQSRFIQE